MTKETRSVLREPAVEPMVKLLRFALGAEQYNAWLDAFEAPLIRDATDMAEIARQLGRLGGFKGDLIAEELDSLRDQLPSATFIISCAEGFTSLRVKLLDWYEDEGGQHHYSDADYSKLYKRLLKALLDAEPAAYQESDQTGEIVCHWHRGIVTPR